MAARKPRTLTAEDVFLTHSEQPPAPSYPVVPPSPEEEVEEDEVTALNNILSEIGGNGSGAGYVNVYREDSLHNGKTDRLYMGQMPASEYVNGGFVESLKQQYGSGKFDLCVYIPGHRGVFARKKITIAGDREVTPPGNLGGVNTSAVVDAINQGNERTLQAILALAQQKQQQPNMMEQLQVFKIMKEIFSPATQTPAASFDPLAAIKLGAELAGKGGNLDDSDGGWATKMIDTFGKPIVDMVMGGVPGAAAPVNPALIPRATIPAPAPAITSTATQTNPETPDVNPMISFYLNTLKAKAIKNEPVEPVADDILARLSASEANDLKGILTPDTWRDTLRKHTAALDQNPEWWGRLRNTILQYIAEDATAHIPDYFAGGLTVIPAAGISANHDSQQPATTNPETAGQGLPGGNP